MKTKDLIHLVLHNLKRMRTRVIMTALGVVIGTAAVMVLVSLGAGLERQSRAYLMGGDLTELQVIAPIRYQEAISPDDIRYRSQGFPGEEAPKFEIVDDHVLHEIRALPGVESVIVYESLMGQVQIVHDHLRGYPSIWGIEPEALATFGLGAASGSLDLRRGQAVVGARFAETVLFDPATRDLSRGSRATTASGPPPDLQDAVVRLRMIRYTDDGTPLEKTVPVQIVGVLEPGGWQYDTSMYMSLRDVLEYNTWINGKRRDPGRQGYSKTIVRAEDIEHTIALEGTLREMGFEPFSQRQEAESANAYFATVQAVLGGIGGVALLVAAFGIANTMLMAIYERTREIGLMKAIGATHRDVMTVFLAEAGGIGLLGGVGGVALGLLVSGVINLIAGIVKAEQVAAGAMPGPEIGIAYTPLWLPCFAVVFAVAVGVASGAYPANRAANLEPLRALKYE